MPKPTVKNTGRSLEQLILAANAADAKRAKQVPKTAEEKAKEEYEKILEAFNKHTEEVKTKIDNMHQKNLFKLQPIPRFPYMEECIDE